jgi:hypothetical protein
MYNQIPSYEIRLKIINLEKLSTRRDHSSSIFVSNILQGNVQALELEKK